MSDDQFDEAGIEIPMEEEPVQENDQGEVVEEIVEEVVETPNDKVEMQNSPVTDVDENSKPTPLEIVTKFLSFLNVNVDELDKIMANWPNSDDSAGTTGKSWMTSYQQALSALVNGDSFDSSLKRENSLWRQKVQHNGAELSAGKPRFASSSGNVISGEKALLKTTSILGMGSIVQIPLWHTGIWISLKAPSEGALLELERRIANERITLGRSTGGMIFSNTSVYVVSHLMNFILNHVYDATVKDITADNLKKLIKITDIPTLVWGIVCTIYPNGYNYSRPCITDPSKCQHVVSGKLSISKLSWTDNKALTDYQRNLMSRRTEKFTQEELDRYQTEHVRGSSEVVTVNEDLKFKLKVPTIAEYELSGFTWVDNIVRLTEGSLGVTLTGDQRDEYIRDHAKVTAIRQYGHWVEEIEVGEDFIQDTETIEMTLSAISSNEEISDTLFEKIGKYIDNSTISLIAIPKYKCPKCHSDQKGDIHQDFHPHLLPIDMIRTFFILLDQRTTKALSRDL